MSRLARIWTAALLAAAFLGSALAAPTMVYLEHSDTLSFDEERLPGCQILTGDVRFRHDSVLMFCDSAFFYDESNLINAYGHIRIEQGDTLFVYGDRLFYNGDTRMARLREHVRMVSTSMTLYTDSLNYDRNTNVGYYFNHGKIVDSTNVLTSVNGWYYTDSDEAVFQRQVVLTNPSFVMHSDTMHYNTNSRIATIVGPSTIDYDSTHIYSEAGWYNTVTERSKLHKNSRINDREGRSMTGDTLYYRRAEQVAEGFSNVCLRDSAQQLQVQGNYGIYHEDTKEGFMVDRATLVEFSSPDSLFLTADTLFYASEDSITTLRANYHVQAWQIDVQGLCDSAFYSTADSTLWMHGYPVIWNDNNQISGDQIQVLMANGQAKEAIVDGNAFVFRAEPDSAYNQISGKKITGYIEEGHLRKIFVNGNAVSVYYAVEEDSTRSYADTSAYIGINRTESSELTIYMNDDKTIKRIVMTPASSGVMYTPDKLTDYKISRLDGFINYESLRPQDQEDIYVTKDRSAFTQVQEENTKHHRKRRK